MDDPTPGDVESRGVKLALIGDVHANLPALETVLSHAKREGVETIWNVGDSVGYGAFPDEVVQRLQQEHAVSIVGNYDLKVLKFKRKTNGVRPNTLWYSLPSSGPATVYPNRAASICAGYPGRYG
jgi:hypothetical protein